MNASPRARFLWTASTSILFFSAGLSADLKGDAAADSRSPRKGCSHLRYDAVLLALEDGQDVYATDLNDRGDVVGATWSGDYFHAQLFSGGKWESLESRINSAAIETYAASINNRGQIVGDFSTVESPFVTYLLDRRGVSYLDAELLFPQEINDHGVIVARIRSTDQPAVWRHGEMTLLPTIAGHAVTYATDINDRGTIVGFTQDADMSNAILLWRPPYTTIEEITLPPGDATFVASEGLNNRNEVVFAIGGIGYVWSEKRGPRLLLAPPEASVEVYPVDINDEGTIVGFADSEEFWRIAVVWRDDEVCLLSDLVNDAEEAADQWLVAEVINARGEIIAAGFDSDGLAHRYLLRPSKRSAR